VLHPTLGQWIVYGILAVLWAVLGYRLSENDRKRLGRTPWGLPSALWAVFWFLSVVLGLVLYLIAHAGEVRRAQHDHSALGGPTGGMPSSMGAASTLSRRPSVAEQFPAYPQPANVQAQPPVTPTDPGPTQPRGEAPADRQAPPERATHGQAGEPAARAGWLNSPPAWHPDPSGRFHFRWWDGYQWTNQVSIDGHHLVDTNPDQRIGPY
jgi:hypothetical protein